MDARVPEVLTGRYELGEIIGSGGNGAVHRAVDLRLGRPVAIKVLRTGTAQDEVARARLRSEAQTAGSLNHPGIARVYDFEAGDSSSDGLAYIAMQLVDGWSLAQLLTARGVLSPAEVMSVVAQVAEALQVVHAAGIVHRDLKPANIMVTRAGRTVLVDFGIARTATSEPLTDTGVLMGTAEYLSPEQAAGRVATAASDLYALGVVAHHCLTGTSPFRRESPVATAVAQLNDAPAPLGADVPDAVAALVAAMTAKDPARRPGSAADVAAAAAAAGPTTGIELPSVSPPAPAPGSASRPTTSRLAAPVRHRAHRRRPAVAFAGVGVAVALLAVTALGVRGVGGPAPTVPDVVGMSASAAGDDVRAAGLRAEAVAVDVAGFAAGTVVEQSPAAETSATDDTTVRLRVASGRVRLAARDVLGRPYVEASGVLEALGFAVERADVVDAAAAGTVVALDRSGRLAGGSTVVLSVGVAPAVPATASAPVVERAAAAPVAAATAEPTDARSTSPSGGGGEANANTNRNGRAEVAAKGHRGR